MNTALLILGCVLVIGWEYQPAMRGGFVYEDAHLTESCGEPFPVNLAGRLATRGLWCAQVNRLQPLWSFHAVNLALHLTVTALVGLLAWTLTRQSVLALLAALLFGANAVAVEAVAYLSGRSELIAAVGVLGACLAALTRRWLAVLPFVLLGCLGKESAAVALVLVPLTLWYARGRQWGLAVKVATGVLLLGIFWQTPREWWWDADTPLQWALLQATAIVRVLALSLLPLGQTVDYDYAIVPVTLRLLSVVMLLAAAGWVWMHRANRALVFGAAWIGLTVLPRLIVPTPRSVFSEHQAYLALVGVAFLLASLLAQDVHDDYRPAL